MFMNLLWLVRNLGLKTSFDRHGVPREDLPTIAEHALRGKNEIHGDVVAFLEELYSSGVSKLVFEYIITNFITNINRKAFTFCRR